MLTASHTTNGKHLAQASVCHEAAGRHSLSAELTVRLIVVGTACCRYINTGGWAKYKIVSYQNTSTIDPCVGMLVRQGDPPIPIREL